MKTLDDPEVRYLYEERAAIMEYDGGLPRSEAELLAAGDVLGDECDIGGDGDDR